LTLDDASEAVTSLTTENTSSAVKRAKSQLASPTTQTTAAAASASSSRATTNRFGLADREGPPAGNRVPEGISAVRKRRLSRHEKGAVAIQDGALSLAGAATHGPGWLHAISCGSPRHLPVVGRTARDDPSHAPVVAGTAISPLLRVTSSDARRGATGDAPTALDAGCGQRPATLKATMSTT
jgi:hypothetical protein